MVMKFIKTYYFDVTSYKIASKYFGSNLPSLESIAKNVSLVLVNTHYSLNRPRPLVPAVIQVGGLHIKEPNRLPAVSTVNRITNLLYRNISRDIQIIH